MRTVISNIAAYEKHLEYLQEPLETQRFLYFTNRTYSFAYTGKLETDEYIYWSHTQVLPMFGKKLFYKYKNVEGVTYNKATKKIKVWFGKRIQYSNYVQLLADEFNLKWFSEMPSELKMCVGNSLMSRVINGKIKNPIEYCNALIKSNPKLRGVDICPNALYKCFVETNPNYYSLVNTLMLLVDPNDYLNDANAKLPINFQSLKSDALVLNRKLDHRWSDEESKAITQDWQKEIRRISKNYSHYQLDYQYPELEDLNFDLPF
jgi:hypothetical protein